MLSLIRNYVEKMPIKIVQDQVPLKIQSKSGAFENIIMEIPFHIFCGTSSESE